VRSGFKRRLKPSGTVEHETATRVFYLYDLRWAHSWSEIECDPQNDIGLSCIPTGCVKRTSICSVIAQQQFATEPDNKVIFRLRSFTLLSTLTDHFYTSIDIHE